MRGVRVAFGSLLFVLIAVIRPTGGAAQAPPEPALRWDGLIERLSAPTQWHPETFSNPRMSRHAVSDDGRYVVFMADLPNPPNPPMRTFFVRDRMTGETTLNGPGVLNAPPVISGDGRHRAVEVCEIYRPDGRNVCDIWTLDAQTYAMQNMSTALDGTPSDGDSSEAMLSRDGRFVVFRTNSPTLLPAGAAPGQIVLRDRDTDQDGIFDEPDGSSLRVVSVSSAGQPGTLESATPEVSADGRFVAFRSRASNLVPGDTNEAWDVFLHDAETGETRRINVGPDGYQPAPTLDSPAIAMSADGGVIAFATDVSYITFPTEASDFNNALDVFVYDRATDTRTRIDLGAGGTLGNGHTHWPSLSADGRYVSVLSNATNVANPGTPGRYHTFVYDRATAQATRVSVLPDGTEPDRDSTASMISGDGSLVAFVSSATNLPTPAPPDTNTIYAAVHFNVTPAALTLSARGGEVRAAVTAQRYVRWSFDLADWSWLNWGMDGAYGMGDGTANFRAYRNSYPTPRTVNATAHSKTIAITQEAGLHVTAFSPSQGPATGGTTITFTGAGFEPDMRVYVGNVEAQVVEFVDTTSLRAVTPPHTAGDAWIYITTGDYDGAAGASTPFRYTDVTPPEMYPPYLYGTQTADGWFTSDVQIAFGFWDPDGPIISYEGCIPPPLTTDTPGTTFTCHATSEGGTSTASVVVKRDATGPAIEIASPAATIYRLGDPAPVASYTCTDALNNATDCNGMVPAGTAIDMSPGYHDFWVTARDNLGNWSGRSMTYAVTYGVCAIRPPGLAAWFPFETVSGESQPSYADAVNGSDGIGINTQFVSGAVGSYAMAASGSSYMRTEAYETFRMTNAFTLAAWVKPGPGTGEFEVIAGREGEYLLGLSPDGTLHWSISTTDRPWGWNRTSTQLQRGVWAHVALVYDGGQVTVFANGISREGWSTTGSIVDVADAFNEFRIGAREDPASPSFFSGAIDDVLLANRGFAPTEVQVIALAANAGLCGPRPATVTVTPDPVTVTYGERLENIYTLKLTSDGSPVGGRTLYFFDPTGLLLAPAPTDANGEIRFGATAFGTTLGTQRGFEARFLGDFYYSAASGSNVLIVEPRASVVTWSAPAAVSYGTALGSQQLNASANVAGTFTYTPAAGTTLAAGAHTLSVTFTPTVTGYAEATATVPLVVTKATPVIALTSPSPIYDGVPHGVTGTITGGNGETLAPLTFSYNGSSQPPVNAGTYDVVASFAGDANHMAASATGTITIDRAPLTVRAADAVKRFGAPLPALTAAIAGFAGSDSVASLGGALALTTTATQQSAVGVYPIVPSGLTSGNYTIAFVAGTLTVVRGAVDVTVATSPEPSGFEAPMTFTASVSAAAPASGTPAGSIRFYDGATLLGSAPINGGTATLSTAGLDAGVRSIEARYEGNESFEPGAASAPHLIQDASQTASIAISSSRNPSNTGQSVTLTAAISMPSGAVSGVIEFYAGATLLGTAPIAAGRATFTTSTLPAGSHAITAYYSGGDAPPVRSNVFVQTVGAPGWKDRTTSMIVTATPNPALLGDAVAVTAEVTGTSGQAPTGRILFIVDGAVVADVAVTAVSATLGRATLAVPGLAHGRHTISATYLGDPTYRGTTARVTVSVN